LRERVLAACGFGAAAWIAYFLLASRLGLFQDDVWMYHIVRFSQDGVLREAFDFSRAYGGEGRPATQVVMAIFTWLGSLMGGLTGLYVMNWILICLTVVLAHACLRHFFTPRASFLAACFLILFPADAAKFFVVSYMAWVGSMLFWLALLLLLRRRIFLSAVALAATRRTSVPSAASVPRVVVERSGVAPGEALVGRRRTVHRHREIHRAADQRSQDEDDGRAGERAKHDHLHLCRRPRFGIEERIAGSYRATEGHEALPPEGCGRAAPARRALVAPAGRRRRTLTTIQFQCRPRWTPIAAIEAFADMEWIPLHARSPCEAGPSDAITCRELRSPLSTVAVNATNRKASTA
jgi:hypothetical protein